VGGAGTRAQANDDLARLKGHGKRRVRLALETVMGEFSNRRQVGTCCGRCRQPFTTAANTNEKPLPIRHQTAGHTGGCGALLVEMAWCWLTLTSPTVPDAVVQQRHAGARGRTLGATHRDRRGGTAPSRRDVAIYEGGVVLLPDGAQMKTSLLRRRHTNEPRPYRHDAEKEYGPFYLEVNMPVPLPGADANRFLRLGMLWRNSACVTRMDEAGPLTGIFWFLEGCGTSGLTRRGGFGFRGPEGPQDRDPG